VAALRHSKLDRLARVGLWRGWRDRLASINGGATMTLDALLTRLDGVRPRGPGRWSAKCPAHDDRSPSLSVREGDRGVLLKCFSGCSLDEICRAVRIEPRELFYDARPDSRARAEHARRRAAKAAAERRRGRFVDAVKVAEAFLDTRKNLDISAWSAERLNEELNIIADAYLILERDLYAADR